MVCHLDHSQSVKLYRAQWSMSPSEDMIRTFFVIGDNISRSERRVLVEIRLLGIVDHPEHRV